MVLEDDLSAGAPVASVQATVSLMASVTHNFMKLFRGSSGGTEATMISGVSAYTWSTPRVASIALSHLRRSATWNSSAAVAAYSGSFKSTPRTQ